MKVGLFLNTQFQPGQSVAAHLPDLISQTRAAREAGFKSLWFPHHFLTGPLQMLQIVPMMAYLAPHAEGMQIGPNILIGAIQSSFILLMARYVFEVPMLGSL